METKEIAKYPLLALRGLTIFPHMTLHFDVGREVSIKALAQAMSQDEMIFLVAQKDFKVDNPTEEDLYEFGTVAKIDHIFKLPGDITRVLVNGLHRAKITDFVSTDPFFEVEAENFEDVNDEPDLETQALIRSSADLFTNYIRLSSKISPDILLTINDIKAPGELADIIAANLFIDLSEKQKLLETFDTFTRLENVYEILSKEIQLLEIENKIDKRLKKQIDKVQKEYYLNEQIKAIKSELGENPDNVNEIQEYRTQIEKSLMPDEVKEKAEKEISRLAKMQLSSPESAVIRNYLDSLIDLPWNIYSDEDIDLKYAKKVLDDEHYGLEKVKDRIIEHLAVCKMTNELNGPILCFVGPPGVGKTSIARSIAHSMKRKFVRMSLGGVRDEAEIRGHRRTYIGAIPGRIITSLKNAQSSDPVFLLDEIDKLGNDFRGDPASALLEVLDSEQNTTFRDHFLDVDFDLSKVFFVTTANTLDSVPPALLDRMEVIRIPGYTNMEKAEIAKRHLIPKQLEKHGLTKSNLTFSKKTLDTIITKYTREAGVRELERTIATVCRKSARVILEDMVNQVKLTEKVLTKFLGVAQHDNTNTEKTNEIGLVNGLAWTSVGGVVMPVEVLPMKGSGKLVLTGQLGDVMKESAQAGFSYVRSRQEELGLPKDFYKETDMHIHIPEGAIPKDGPSAGITMATALISALSNKAVRHDIAMTGEISLRGKVLPIGGLKEKSLAAHRAGIYNVIIPYDNKKDIVEIPQTVRDVLNITPVKTLDDVLKIALVENKK